MASALEAIVEYDQELKTHALHKMVDSTKFDPRPLTSLAHVNHHGIIALTEIERNQRQKEWFTESMYINPSFYAEESNSSSAK